MTTKSMPALLLALGVAVLLALLSCQPTLAQEALNTMTAEAVWTASASRMQSIELNDRPAGAPLSSQFARVGFSPFKASLLVPAAENSPDGPANLLSVSPTLAGGISLTRIDRLTRHRPGTVHFDWGPSSSQPDGVFFSFEERNHV